MITLSNLTKFVYEKVKDNRKSEKTAKAYQEGMKHFYEYLKESGFQDDDTIETLKIDHFINYPSWLNKLQLSNSSNQVYLASVKYLLNELFIAGTMNIGYADKVRYDLAIKQATGNEEEKLVRNPDPEMVENIRRAIYWMKDKSPQKERAIAIIEFLYATGCRNEELTLLTVEKINLKRKRVLIMGKRKKERVGYLLDETIKALDNYWNAREDRVKTHPAFCRHDKGAGKTPKRITTETVRTTVDLAVTLAGYDPGSFTPHWFRHAFATRVLRSTNNIKQVKELLGHANINTTDKYAHTNDDELAEAHKKAFE